MFSLIVVLIVVDFKNNENTTESRKYLYYCSFESDIFVVKVYIQLGP